MAGALVTNGSLDWVSLSKSSVNFSIDILGRFSGAGVEALTVAVSQALFAQFHLPAEGQKRLQDSLSKLKAFSSIGNVLWFGFGVKHLTRTLAETEAGACCVAMCACMMVSYDREYCARVLRTLCRASSMPEHLAPALAQWAAISDLCAGAVTASKFPVLVEGFCRLFETEFSRNPFVAATNPDRLAMGLQELVRVSSGSVQNVTFVGSVDCGWLAALAEWLFSLRVCITDAVGNQLYHSQGSNIEGIGYHQVIFIRLDQGQNRVPQLSVRHRTFLVPPGELPFANRLSRDICFRRGSSEWSTILTDTFGACFLDLLDTAVLYPFAKILYCLTSDTTRITYRLESNGSILAHAWVKNNYPWRKLLLCKESGDRPQKFKAIMSFISARLPELDLLAKYGIAHASELETDFRMVTESTEQFLHSCSLALSKKCACKSCTNKHPNFMCLFQVAVTIYHYVVTLYWLDIDDNLRPSSVGLLHLAYRCNEREKGRINDAAPYLYTSAMVSTIFTGVDPNHGDSEASAFSVNGVCTYMPVLEHQELSVDRHLRLRLVPGQMERNCKLYKRLIDVEVRAQLLESPMASCFNEVSRFGSNPNLQILVEETIDTSDLSAQIVVIPSIGNVFGKIGSDLTAQGVLGGPARMIESLRTSLTTDNCIYPCKSTQTERRWRLHHTEDNWSHRCSISEMPWWTQNSRSQKTLVDFANLNEWVLMEYGSQAPLIQIFRGSPNVLYYLLLRYFQESHHFVFNFDSVFLMDPNDCVMCAFKLDPKISTATALIIRSYVENQIETLQIPINPERVRGHRLGNPNETSQNLPSSLQNRAPILQAGRVKEDRSREPKHNLTGPTLVSSGPSSNHAGRKTEGTSSRKPKPKPTFVHRTYL